MTSEFGSEDSSSILFMVAIRSGKGKTGVSLQVWREVKGLKQGSVCLVMYVKAPDIEAIGHRWIGP